VDKTTRGLLARPGPTAVLPPASCAAEFGASPVTATSWPRSPAWSWAGLHPLWWLRAAASKGGDTRKGDGERAAVVPSAPSQHPGGGVDNAWD